MQRRPYILYRNSEFYGSGEMMDIDQLSFKNRIRHSFDKHTLTAVGSITVGIRYHARGLPWPILAAPLCKLYYNVLAP
jgi:hypothetical protein